MYRCMTGDIITSYTMGKSYELLSRPQESESYLDAFAFTFRLLWLLRETPYLTHLIRWIGKTAGRWMTSKSIIPTLLRWQWLRNLKRIGLAPSPLTSIMLSYIYNSLPPEEKTAQHLHDTTNMLLAAGFETTGFTLTTATVIMAHPIQAPYLSAVIKESLRLSLGAITRLPRVNKHKDMRYGSWVIPKGTAVSMSHTCMHYNEDVFPDPKAFRPERWLGGQEESKRLESLANAELYLTLATLFRTYDFQLYDTTLADVAPARDFFVPVPEPGGNGLRVLVRPLSDRTPIP
ncbi:cytochrome P450 monooxygenase [Physcia stellaris]|nr:cytochrome P450 monooxygenase [Physcia stellaris]